MKLYVYVLEGKDLHVKNCYVKLQVGKQKSKTKILRNPTNNLIWNEEFVFRVHDMDEELIVSVYDHDIDPGFFHGSGGLMGRIRLPIWSVVAEDNHTLAPTWLSLEKPKRNKGKHIDRDSGKILLTVSLHGKLQESQSYSFIEPMSDFTNEEPQELFCVLPNNGGGSTKSRGRKKTEGKQLIKSFTNRLEKLFHKNEDAFKTIDSSSEYSSIISENDYSVEEFFSDCSFEEALEIMKSKENEQEMPENLQGGVLVDQAYAVSPNDLNTFLFAPNSQFRKELAELNGTTDLHEEPWTWSSGDTSCLTRVVSSTKAASKLVKACKAIEEQTYVRACGKEFAVFVSVSTPEVPYGNAFKVELLYKIMPGPEEESSHLVISWGINFLQSTMMRGMIESGARQGLKESFDQFSNLLAQNFKTVDSKVSAGKDHILATLATEHQSDLELASEYFWNITVLTTICMVVYIVVHILLSEPSQRQGLEFFGIDLPDSFGELITSGILVLYLEHVYHMASRFVQARLQRGCDHGVKAQGDGWVLTVALVEGVNLTSLGSSNLSDPYVVFTCNAKTRTSSVKLQTSNPQWNEILEFDAMEEPPSVLDVEVYDFDGPFDQATSLGHAEINFLKHSSSELADIWISLEGKLAQSSQSKLHLRIFLDNNNGEETIRDYLNKMEKEVGKKLNLRSPHKNSTFQKLFNLPPEEFLISDFTCQLKRKMPLQGRLFLSARIVGFYSNLFGYKTKFFFLWEDIEDIQVLPPSISSVGSPILVIILKKDRGLDAKHGAKSQDEEGRLRFCFQSFVSFNVASRTIMAMRRSRILTPDQRAHIAEEQEDQEEKPIMVEESDFVLEAENVTMSKIYASELPINLSLLMEMFDGGKLELKVMEKSGCLYYSTTPWEPFKDDILERKLSYRFNRYISVFGGEITCTQQKFPIRNSQGWILNEVMTFHNVPFCDHYRVHFRYQIEKSVIAQNVSKCDVDMGITWLKSTKFQQRITQNITDTFRKRFKEIFSLVEKEILLATQVQHTITS
ncbi:C2 and GRAM domain-containing protein At5g50170 [Cannabis sativa]|uniref:C2 and GRAM domain-containing protein At5g50170 n=1 Tax=Cannabis sativa TaxID=3483 RepID=UPI0029C9EAA6|nr:C2 and GRAM domain-containing protein At5g50170 [Cannabis sativa]